jgi:Dicarboxylate transport
MDMANISASGIFDGRLPMVFDQNGGRIEHGALQSRAPGGNVSYVGVLSYKDMSTMANFAFDALKSIDYRQMNIELDGDVAGEMVTRVSFDGIRQGQIAKRNFITRQIAKLPIRFNVNLRAPFFKMVNSFRSLYDPHYVLDPRGLGLVDGAGKVLRPGQTGPDNHVQPPVSGAKP